MLSAIEYPHWLMRAGADLVLAGLVGGAVQRNRQSPEADKATLEPDDTSQSGEKRNDPSA
ncbi:MULTISPECIES: hypothetical protein [unclassified Bradyrhizobium]|uniref:hypothetical protein n=1 Tax=unclassified Bradyrhizobium TaxID=2631580 RepID=UPI00339B2750